MSERNNNWLITGGRLIDPKQGIDAPTDLLITDGKIARVGRAADWERGLKVERLDATGLVIAPGFIDLHTHLREPGFEYKETIESGTKAAAAGGFTTICCMPNTRPVNDNRSVTELIVKQSQRLGGVRVLPVGAITKGSKGEELAEMGELKEAGCVAFSDDGRPVMNGQTMRRAMDYARGLDGLIIDHCEDLTLSAGGSMREGIVSLQLGLQGIPSAAEEAMVARDLALVELTGCRFHVAHVSSANSVRMIRDAKQRGLPVTAETCPHYLALTDEAVIGYRTEAKMNPPLGGRKDQEALIEGLADGTIDAIATDHAPHASDEKEREFACSPFGVIGLETAFGIGYELVRQSRLPLVRLIELLTVNPASIIHSGQSMSPANGPGTLAVGSPADLVLLALDQSWTVEPRIFQSKSRNSPFAGWTLHGQVRTTMVDGRTVYSHGQPI
ncbi:MAG TPA: dihydroorotase [Nitrospiria bacterium]|nr:dihydroorotase [Nitrospiria bacterium]